MKGIVIVSAVLLPVLAGCGPGQGRVSGRVLFDGQPLPAGWVTFRPADPRQNSIPAELDEQGNYAAVLPAGEVMVSVDNREWEPQPSLGSPLPPGLPPDVAKALGGSPDKPAPKPSDGPAGKPSPRYVKIPERYYEAETSGLQFTVQGGEQKHDIELKK